MSESSLRKPATSLVVKGLLMIGGVLAAFVLVTLLLMLFPGLVRGLVPYERDEAGTEIDIEFRVTDGDMFAWFPGKVRPPPEDTVLVAYHLKWDENSFRVPARVADHYPIAAFGDSYTEATNVVAPWPDKVAELLDVPVRNYGYRDYGPIEEARAVQEFAGKEPRSWVLVAYFSGNDLSNSNRTALVQERSPFYLMPGLAARVAGQTPVPPPPVSDHYDYPLPVIIGGYYYEMVLFPSYLWAQLAPPEGFEASRTLQIVSEQLDTMAQAVPEATCLALIFAPTKEQLYYPFIYPTERRWIHGVGQEAYLNEQQLVALRDRPYSEEDEPALMAHLDDQHDAVMRLAASKPRWRVIDLLPAFKEAVGRGELLYYPYDSHWNQAGHDLAGQVIADALRAVPDCKIQ